MRTHFMQSVYVPFQINDANFQHSLCISSTLTFILKKFVFSFFCNQTYRFSYIIIAIIATTLIIASEAKRQGIQHCNDRMRALIVDSCRTLNALMKSRRESREVHPNEIVEDDTTLDANIVQFLDNESEYAKQNRFLFAVLRCSQCFWR